MAGVVCIVRCRKSLSLQSWLPRDVLAVPPARDARLAALPRSAAVPSARLRARSAPVVVLFHFVLFRLSECRTCFLLFVRPQEEGVLCRSVSDELIVTRRSLCCSTRWLLIQYDGNYLFSCIWLMFVCCCSVYMFGKMFFENRICFLQAD